MKNKEDNQRWRETRQEKQQKSHPGPLRMDSMMRARSIDTERIFSKCQVRLKQKIGWWYGDQALQDFTYSSPLYNEKRYNQIELNQTKDRRFTKKIKMIQNFQPAVNLTHRFLAGLDNSTLVVYKFDCNTSADPGIWKDVAAPIILSKNSNDFGYLDDQSDGYHFILSGGVRDLEVIMLDSELNTSILVDSSSFKAHILNDVNIIDKINMRWSGPGLIDLTLDGDGIYFYSYQVKISKVVRSGNKTEYSVTLQSRERYLKPVSFADAHCDSTKDFIACILYSERVGSYFSPYKKKQVEILSKNSTTLAVWAKKDGKYQGNGLTYRLEAINPEDPTMSLIVGNYSTNQISYIKGINLDSSTDYNWKVKTVNLNKQVKILFNETVSTIKEIVNSQNLNITANNWTSETRSIILTPVEYNKWYKRKLGDQSNTIALLVGGIFLVGVILISFLLVRQCVKEKGDVNDITRAARDVLNRNASSLMAESEKNEDEGLPSDSKGQGEAEIVDQTEENRNEGEEDEADDFFN